MLSRHSTQSAREGFNIVPLGMVNCHIGQRLIISADRHILQTKPDTDLYKMNQRENTKMQTIMVEIYLTNEPADTDRQSRIKNQNKHIKPAPSQNHSDPSPTT